MDCPGCDGELEYWRSDELTGHWFCPGCRPGYTDPDPLWFTVFSIVVFVVAQPLALLIIGWDRLTDQVRRS